MQHFRLLVLPACAALVLSACTSEDPEPTAVPSTAAPTVTESPTPSPEPEPTPSEEPSPVPEPSPSPTEFQSFPPAPEGETEEQRAIREGWEEHQRVMDEYLKDPTKRNLLPLQATVTGKADEETVAGYMDFAASGLKRVGNVRFVEVIVGDPYDADDGLRTAEVTYCQDFTGQSYVDVDSGEEALENPIKSMSGVSLMVFDKRERWVVAERRDGEVGSC